MFSLPRGLSKVYVERRSILRGLERRSPHLRDNVIGFFGIVVVVVLEYNLPRE